MKFLRFMNSKPEMTRFEVYSLFAICLMYGMGQYIAVLLFSWASLIASGLLRAFMKSKSVQESEPKP
jgi:hypothetical protein